MSLEDFASTILKLENDMASSNLVRTMLKENYMKDQ